MGSKKQRHRSKDQIVENVVDEILNVDKKSNLKKDIIYIVISLSTVLLIVAFIILGYYYKRKTNNLYKDSMNKIHILNTAVLLNDIVDIDSEENTSKIEKYNNIDESIKSIKASYYKNLKTFEDKVAAGQVNYKIAYLTFDDGPYYLTNSVLNVLSRYNVLATFFTIGLDKDVCYDNRNASCKDMYLKEANLGHTVANHTYSHRIFGGLYSSGEALAYQVKLQEDLIRTRTGNVVKIMRFPGGSGTAGYYGVKNSAVAQLRSMGYGYVDWTAQDGDGGDPGTPAQAFQTFKNSINERIEVVLLHDYSTVTYSILPQIIEYLKQNNYVLLPLFYESRMINK